MAMDWLRNKVGELLDTVADVKHDATDRFVRCASTNNGNQCIHDKGHSTSHEDAEGQTW